MRFPCAQAREAQAYATQERWLAQFDLTLETAFEMDAMTLLLLRTRCLMP